MKYIHQTNSQFTANAKISSHASEPGYTLYAEIDCQAFDDIMKNEYDAKCDGITDLSSSVIVCMILDMCQKCEKYANVPYSIRIHRNNAVEVYSKTIERDAANR